MFGLFEKVAKRVGVEKEVRDFFSHHTNIDFHKAKGFRLAKATDSYLEEIEKYPNPTDEEELIVYLMILHDVSAFDFCENEQVLGIIIKLIKHDESQSAVDGYRSPWRKELRDRVRSWAQRKVLS